MLLAPGSLRAAISSPMAHGPHGRRHHFLDSLSPDGIAWRGFVDCSWGGKDMRLLFSIIAVLLLAEPGLGQKPQDGRIEEIVVRARKRDELLVDTPVSVTAITDNELREVGVTRLDEIQGLVPNLQFSLGRENQEGFIRLRGVGTTSGEIVFDPGVAVYVDGVFLPRMIGQLSDVVDIQQIEVLRGPQGTLFGKNSVGGAVNMITVKPQPELGADLLVRGGRFDTVRTRVSANLPLIEDRLLSRFAFATNQTSGFARNELLNLDASDQNAMSFLGSLQLLLTDDITVDLSGTWARNHGHGRGGQCRVVDPLGLATANMPGFIDACNASGKYRFQGNVPGYADTTSWGSWGTVTWDVLQGDVDLTLKNITSWREQKPHHRSDSDYTELPVLSLNFAGDDENPGWSQRQISEELQSNLSAWDDRFSLVTGVFAFWERGTAPTRVSTLGGFLDVDTRSTTKIKNWTWAIYTHAVLDPVDWLSLTFGIRYTQDKKGASFSVTDLNAGTTDGPLFGSKVFDDVTPTASIGLKAPDWLAEPLLLDHGLLYFTWAQGFRGGGYNALINVQLNEDQGELPSFDPETLDSFELGLKTVAFDNRLSLSIAGFYNKYDDIQVVATRATGDLNDPDTITLQQITQNAAKATVQGLELEMLWNPIDQLTLNGSLGLLDTNYDDFGKNCDPQTGVGCAISDATADPARGAYIDRSGQGFNVTPDLTAHVAVSYDFAIDGAPWEPLIGTVTPRIDWSYQSRMHVLGPEVADAVQRGFNLVHARLGYRFWDDRAEIALWGKNLGDVRVFDRAETYAILGFIARYYQSPRTYGGEISLSF